MKSNLQDKKQEPKEKGKLKLFGKSDIKYLVEWKQDVGMVKAKMF